MDGTAHVPERNDSHRARSECRLGVSNPAVYRTKQRLDWRRDGLTAHENWWPALYRAACARWGIAPDPQVEAFDISYRDSRADLKTVSAE